MTYGERCYRLFLSGLNTWEIALKTEPQGLTRASLARAESRVEQIIQEQRRQARSIARQGGAA